MYSSNVGLIASLVIGVILGLIYIFVASTRITRQPRILHNPLLENPLILALPVFGASFCLAFAILNPLLQLDRIDMDEARSQLADGTLILRFTTIFFSGTILWKSMQFLRREKEYPIRIGDRITFEGNGLSDRDRAIRDSAQSGIFIATLFMLWVLSARDVNTTATALLAYVFAFFCDDWMIISEYSKELRGRILKWHRMRINLANLLLIGPLAAIAWQEFSWWGITLCYSAISLLLLPRYIVEPWLSREGVSEHRFTVERGTLPREDSEDEAGKE